MVQRNTESSTQEPLYTPIDGVNDEACSSDGQLHSHWQGLLQNLSDLGAENLNQRHSKTQRILRDDGATYKPYD